MLLKLQKPLILASKSPRRQKLLHQIGFNFEVIPSRTDEDEIDSQLEPSEYARQLSFEKANEVAGRIKRDVIILGCDTIVVLDGVILTKPTDHDDAFRILKLLSNRTHIVYTGVTFIDYGDNNVISGVKATEVTFRKLDDDEVEEYIEGGSPMDKAGAYGIQDDFGAVFVSQINGCYYNIVGLPLEMMYAMMKQLIT
jgi:septum formation protein